MNYKTYVSCLTFFPLKINFLNFQKYYISELSSTHITNHLLFIYFESNLYFVFQYPIQNKKYLLPVLFWIHGGQFLFESGTIEYYNPKYLMDYQIIVVSINYRLGPFGNYRHGL